MDFRIKSLLSTAFLIVTASVANAAEVFYVPSFCDPAQLKIQAQNPSKQPQRFWTQNRVGEELQERHFDLQAGETLNVDAEMFLTASQAFSIKTWEPDILRFTAQCADEPKIPLSTITSPEISHYFPRGVRTVKMKLANLFLESQPVLLTAYSKTGTVIGTQTVKLKNYYDTQAIKWNLDQDIARVDVRGEARLHSWAFFDTGLSESLSPALALKPAALATDQGKTYFLISTRDAKADESYVIALSDDAQIKTARAQIKQTGFEKILVARIQIGHGQMNRNFYSKDKSPYSWSVSQVDAFADFAHISCDGSPDLTEERLIQNLNEGGRICFWRYRVVRELKPIEVSTGNLIP